MVIVVASTTGALQLGQVAGSRSLSTTHTTISVVIVSSSTRQRHTTPATSAGMLWCGRVKTSKEPVRKDWRPRTRRGALLVRPGLVVVLDMTNPGSFLGLVGLVKEGGHGPGLNPPRSGPVP
jgi:hypothetical protein